MCRSSLLLLLSLPCITLACTNSEEPSGDEILITSASVVDVASGTISVPQDVLLSAGRITQITDSKGKLSARPGAMKIDADGLFLLTGLIDVHAHIGDGGLHENSREDRDRAILQFLRYGVTSIFVAGGGGGNEDHLRSWKAGCQHDELICPRVFGSGSIITAYGSHPITTNWGMPADTDAAVTYVRGAVSVRPADAVEPVIAQKIAASVDALKIVVEDGPGFFAPKPRLTKEKIEDIVAEAHKHDLRVVLPSHSARIPTTPKSSLAMPYMKNWHSWSTRV